PGKGNQHSSGGLSDTSSGGSILDDTDREVSSLTDRAFRSLCIGEEAIYNDSDLGSSPSAQRERHQAFSQDIIAAQEKEDRERDALKRAAHESFSLSLQQYGQGGGEAGWEGEGRMWTGQYGLENQGYSGWEGQGEGRTEGRVSTTFQHSFIDVSQQEKTLREERLSFLSYGGSDTSWQQRRSRSRVSSLIKAFSSEGYGGGDGWMEGKLRDWNNESSWDKSALMSIQRELSEFSTAYPHNFNTGAFPAAGTFSQQTGPLPPSRNSLYPSEVSSAVSQMDKTSSFMRSSHRKHCSKQSMFAQLNSTSNFFLHSEFSPFQPLWRDHNRFPFQQGGVSGFMSPADFPKWYDSPMYKELTFEQQFYAHPGIKETVYGPQRKALEGGSTVLQKASALEKRSESELVGHHPPWKRTQSVGSNRYPSLRPSTVSPTSERSRRGHDAVSAITEFQHTERFTKLTAEQSVTTVLNSAEQSSAVKGNKNSVISFHNKVSTVAVEQGVVASNTSTTPFNITQLLTPVIHNHQDTSEALQYALSPSVAIEQPPATVAVDPGVVASNTSTTPFNFTQQLTPVIHNPQDTDTTSEVQQYALSPSLPLEQPTVWGERERERRGATPEVRMSSYKSRASGLLFNLKDNRKRVKSTYSPTKFKGLEVTGRSKSNLDGYEPRDTVIDMPAILDISVPQVVVQEEPNAIDTSFHPHTNPQYSPSLQPTTAHSDQHLDYTDTSKPEAHQSVKSEEERMARQKEEEKERREQQRQREEEKKEEERRARRREEERMARQKEEEKERREQQRQREEEKKEEDRRARQREEERMARQKEEEKNEKERREQQGQREEEKKEEERRTRQREAERMARQKEEKERREQQRQREEEKKEEEKRARQREEERMVRQKEEEKERREQQRQREEEKKEEERRARQREEERMARRKEEEKNEKERREQQRQRDEEKKEEERREQQRQREEEKVVRQKEEEKDRIEQQRQKEEKKEEERRARQREEERMARQKEEEKNEKERREQQRQTEEKKEEERVVRQKEEEKDRIEQQRQKEEKKEEERRVRQIEEERKEEMRRERQREEERIARQKEEDLKEEERRAQQRKKEERLSKEFTAPSETTYTHPYSRLLSRRNVALDDDDSRSMISNMSGDVESYATSVADLSDSEFASRGGYGRPDSACSFISDVGRPLGKPPTVPPKSEKALRRAKRLTTRRIKKESKTETDSTADLVEKPVHAVASVPSSPSELRSSNRHARASPHFAAPISLPLAPTHISSLTQKKVLQDPGSGQYFVVDMPVQVKTKTFFDPETRKYVQLNVRQPDSYTQPQPQTYPPYTQPQAPPASRSYVLYQGYPQRYQPMPVSSLPTHRSLSEMSALVSPTQDPQPTEESQGWAEEGERHGEGWSSQCYEGEEEIIGRETYGQSYSQEQTPYMDTAHDTHTVHDTHAAYVTHNQLDKGAVDGDDTNSAPHRDIITMSELEDFAMDSGDW
uniref:DUF4585 domain-containing protein n=1 Tax=Oncorhynchus mykiss TaxID=8022 RepID=A0A8K9X2G1_ONCMY